MNEITELYKLCQVRDKHIMVGAQCFTKHIQHVFLVSSRMIALVEPKSTYENTFNI